MEQTLADSTLQAATHMAAAGQYHAASALLDTLESLAPPLDAVLLQAKILAQQGRYAEAITQWHKVLAVAPEHSEAQQGLHLAQRLQATGNPGFSLRANLYYGLGALASLVFLLALAYLVGCNVGYSRQQQRDAAVISQQSTALMAYLEAQHKALQASQQQHMHALAELTQQQETLHTRTLAQFAKIAPVLDGVQQAILQTQTQTTATLTTLQQRLAVLSNGIETEQRTRQAADQGRYAEATHVQESLTNLASLVAAQSQQLTAYLAAQRQTLQDNQP